MLIFQKRKVKKLKSKALENKETKNKKTFHTENFFLHKLKIKLITFSFKHYKQKNFYFIKK